MGGGDKSGYFSEPLYSLLRGKGVGLMLVVCVVYLFFISGGGEQAK